MISERSERRSEAVMGIGPRSNVLFLIVFYCGPISAASSAIQFGYQFIYPGELFLLALWLCLPALLIGTTSLIALLRRRRSGAIIGVVAFLSAIFTIAGSIVLWVSLPPSWSSASALPGPGLVGLIPPLFPSGLIAGGLVYSGVIWAAFGAFKNRNA